MSRRFWVFGGVITGGHLLVSFILFSALFTAGMERFEHGGEAASWESGVEMALGVLSFPVVLLFWTLPIGLPALLQNALFVINSGIWGFGIAWVISRVKSALVR